MTAVSHQIFRQRNGEPIDLCLTKNVVESFVLLGLDENDPTKSTLDIYTQYFQGPFINATETYYKAESEAFITANTITDYMKKAETRLQEEGGRVQTYLHQSTQSPLISKCVQVLQEEAPAPKKKPKKGGPEKKSLEVSHEIYVQALLAVHGTYAGVVQTAFKGDAGFAASLDRACREFVNQNAVCVTGSTKSPELLAKYCDELLKKANKISDEADIHVQLNKVMTVFKYVEDEDVFQKFYSQQLAKRLVFHQLASEDAESSMISKLKEACGYEYTSKLARMFTDMGLSKHIETQFRLQMDREQHILRKFAHILHTLHRALVTLLNLLPSVVAVFAVCLDVSVMVFATLLFPNSRKYQVFVRGIRPPTFPLYVLPDDKVSSVKQKIFIHTGVRPHDQVIRISGKLADHEQSLKEAGAVPNCQIFMTARLRGGANDKTVNVILKTPRWTNEHLTLFPTDHPHVDSGTRLLKPETSVYSGLSRIILSSTSPSLKTLLALDDPYKYEAVAVEEGTETSDYWFVVATRPMQSYCATPRPLPLDLTPYRYSAKIPDLKSLHLPICTDEFLSNLLATEWDQFFFAYVDFATPEEQNAYEQECALRAFYLAKLFPGFNWRPTFRKLSDQAHVATQQLVGNHRSAPYQESDLTMRDRDGEDEEDEKDEEMAELMVLCADFETEEIVIPLLAMDITAAPSAASSSSSPNTTTSVPGAAQSAPTTTIATNPPPAQLSSQPEAASAPTAPWTAVEDAGLVSALTYHAAAGISVLETAINLMENDGILEHRSFGEIWWRTLELQGTEKYGDELRKWE
ncbi:hypothetical protein HDV00_008760 [Rhizophlyctis rosea]|nr:hypothetical protein HDV00_008760 [Rhizophlyctis rosea]